MAEKMELIMVIVNNGYSDEVMDAARQEGARGGTIMNARGTATKAVEEKYGIQIASDKEVLLILVPEQIRDKVLTAIYKRVGVATLAQGIAFSLPVTETIGIKG